MTRRFRRQYEDFPQAGLVLIGPTSPDYKAMLAQIKARHLRTDDAGMPEDPSESVVFFNKSEKCVALLQVLWRFQLLDGSEIVGSCAWAGAESLLVPFGLTPEMKRAIRYRSAILPGSKRYITNGGEVIGDNSDVRPPAAVEVWQGGWISGSGGGYAEPREPTRLRISIEGAFFEDGEFVGTNGTKLFERTVAKADAAAKMAEMANQKGKSARSILDEIQRRASEAEGLPRLFLIPDPSIPISVYGQVAFRELALNVDRNRKYQGDNAALKTVRSWATTEAPVFRKLDVAVSQSVI